MGLLQNFALLLQIFALLQSFSRLFGINCTEIDQSQSSIISVYIIMYVKSFLANPCGGPYGFQAHSVAWPINYNFVCA